MSERPTVAALMAVHREPEDLLRQAFQSLLLQSHPLDQIVVIDDSGKGSYENFIKTFHANSGSKCDLVYIPNQNNLGLVSSLNTGLAACSTNIVARMDADDISLPYRIEVQMGMMAKGYELVGGSIIRFGPSGSIYAKYPTTRLKMLLAFLHSNPFAHPAVMFKKETILSLGGYHNVAHAEDLDLWVRCLGAGVRMANVSMPVLMYRLHAHQVSEIYLSTQLDSARAVRQRVLRAMFMRIFKAVSEWRLT